MKIDSEGERYRMFTRRAAILGGLQVAAAGALGFRLFQLGVRDSSKYRLQADQNRLSVRLTEPARGQILDRFGRVLAGNKRDFRVFMIPEEVEDAGKTLEGIFRDLELDPAAIPKIRRKIGAQKPFFPVLLADGMTWEQFARVNVVMPDYPGVYGEEGVSRFYPSGVAAMPVIGYVNSVSDRDIENHPDVAEFRIPNFKKGKEGLELGFDEDLRGRAGTASLEVNAVGRVVREVGAAPPVAGRTISLTIDAELQKFAAERFGYESGAAIVIDLKDGALRALVSAPAADPNLFVNGISFRDWERLRKDPLQPLINKAMHGAYPPGSTFKPLVAIAAQEAGIDPKETVHCTGGMRFGNRVFHCWKKGGHGTVDMTGSIVHSCDVYYYTMALRIGIEKIAEVARRFGLGETWDIGIPGMKSGLVPDPEWKRKRYRQPWYKGETLNAGIGQGYLLATPLQLAVAAARIASGRAITPYVVRPGPEENVPEAEALTINPEHLALVHQGMAGVTSPGGTAWNAHLEGEGLSMAGKTGTAQVRGISRAERARGVPKYQDVGWLQRDHALFIAHGPVEQPRYACAVLVEHGGSGSQVAAPVARDIMRAALTLDRADRTKDQSALIEKITPPWVRLPSPGNPGFDARDANAEAEAEAASGDSRPPDAAGAAAEE